MINFRLYIVGCLVLMVGFTSCKSTKTIAGKKSEVNQKKSTPTAEMTAFFEAEKARIKGDRAKARSLYRDFVKTYSNNAAAYYNLAKLEFGSFQLKPAEEYAAKAVNLFPKNKYYLEFYADVLSMNKKPKKAVEIYEELAKLNGGNNDEYIYKQYKIYAEIKDYNRALKTLNKLENSWGISQDITMQKVEMLLKQKKEDAAIKEVQKLINDEPRNPRHKEQMADLYDKIGRKEEAKKMYSELINDASDDAKILMRASSYFLRNNDTIGFQNVVKGIVGNPNIEKSIRMSMFLPLIELNSDSAYIQKEILPLVKTLKKDDSNNAETALLYADILYSARQFRPAAKAYKEYLKLEKSKFAAWFKLMLSYSNLEELDSLISVADESFDYFPNNAFTHYFKGTAHFQKKEYEESISSLESAIELEPEKELKAQIFSLLGDAHNSLKQYDDSDQNFEKSLKLKEDAGTLNNYAYYLSLRNEKLEEALKMSARSLELEPGSKTFLDTYGWILYKQGKFKKAKEFIEKAIEGPGDADVLEHLGDVHYKLNEAEKAIEYWQRARNAGGGGSEMLDKKIQNKKIYE